MLRKFFESHCKFTCSSPPVLAAPTEEIYSSALKIVHAGGIVECYYMAMPAVRIMDKYPSFLLTKPEIFQRPWDAIVTSDQILAPGEKYFVVSRRTVKKLQRKIKKSNGPISIDISVKKLLDSGSDKLTEAGEERRKMSERKKHEFVGIDMKAEDDSVELADLKAGVGRVWRRSMPAWQPSLTTVVETHGLNE